MGRNETGAAGYEPPRYRAADDAPWYHVLHGNVPEHQIDFMYGPEVPQGLLTPTHFSHIARLMKYIEPQTDGAHAFAIGNLSRDDTQHEAGHGAIALIFAFRVGGATDHAGRGHPPFAHGIAAIDREVRPASLLEAAVAFHRRMMSKGGPDSPASAFYRAYVRAVLERPERVSRVLARHVASFDDLPRLPRSDLSWAWVADPSAQPRRVVIVHGDDEPFTAVAGVASRLAAVLFRSDIKWTSITTGREADIPGGLSVRLVAERDAPAEDSRGRLLRIKEVPEDEAEIARAVFGARPHGADPERLKPVGWRERYAAQGAQAAGAQEGAARTGLGDGVAGREQAEAGAARAGGRAGVTEGAREQVAPVEEQLVPVEEQLVPLEEQLAPVGEQQAPVEARPASRRWRKGAALGAGATLAAVASVLGVVSEPARDEVRTAEVAAPPAAVRESGADVAAPAPSPAPVATSSPGAPPAAERGARTAQGRGSQRAPARSTRRRTPPPPAAAETAEPTVFDSAPVFR
ncbi:hypothetical protein [Sorangium sp. So ce1024]|uniref:hypothetical protein n=1 Tax=Sorangium sp. So ce1024 TaxID=3133327 RepID=UPI003F044DDA